MRVYISVDLEGVNGISHSSQTQPGEPGYERALTLMHAETNAVIEGLIAGGAEEIVINDSHWDMRNLRIEKLNPGASLISGWQKPFSMVSGVADTKADVACFVGYHARAGVACGTLSHTYRAKVFLDVKLNGRSVGETGLNAALAGWLGVPVGLVTGDDALAKEAEDWLGKVPVVQTKTAVSRYSAKFKPFEETLAALKAGAHQAMLDKKNWKLLKPESPSTLEITMFDPAMADGAELVPDVKRVSDRTVSVTHDDYSVLFKLMLAIGVIGASRKDDYF